MASRPELAAEIEALRAGQGGSALRTG